MGQTYRRAFWVWILRELRMDGGCSWEGIAGTLIERTRGA
jgi:hypothetical protein